MFSYAEGFTMSAKKDAIINIGGLIGIKEDEELLYSSKNHITPYEGFVSYGGLAGRDMEALARGLREGVNEDYLHYRISRLNTLATGLWKAEFPFNIPQEDMSIRRCKKCCLIYHITSSRPRPLQMHYTLNQE